MSWPRSTTIFFVLGLHLLQVYGSSGVIQSLHFFVVYVAFD